MHLELTSKDLERDSINWYFFFFSYSLIMLYFFHSTILTHI